MWAAASEAQRLRGPPEPEIRIYHEGVAPAEWQREASDFLYNKNGQKQVYPKHDVRAPVRANMRDCIGATLAFDEALQAWCRSKDGPGKIIPYAAEGGIATSAFTREYSIVIPTTSEALSTQIIYRETKDADLDVDWESGEQLWEGLARHEVKGYGGNYFPPHLMGPGSFEHTKDKYYWRRQEEHDGPVEFDLALNKGQNPFRVNDFYPKLDAFDKRLIRRVAIYEDAPAGSAQEERHPLRDVTGERKILGHVNVYRAPVILLMKLGAHPRTGGLGGAVHKDLLDICKIMEVWKRNHDAVKVHPRDRHLREQLDQLDLTEGSESLQFLMNNLDKSMHAKMYAKARKLSVDKEATEAVARWELDTVQRRLQGYQPPKDMEFSAYLHKIGAFGEKHVQSLAARYREALKDFAEVLESSVHHQRSLEKHSPISRAEFSASYGTY